MNCSSKDCGRLAVCVPKIRVPAEGWPIALHQPLTLLMQMPLCQACFDALKIEEFVGDQSDGKLRQVIRLGATGRQPPDFARAYFERVSIGSGEYRQFCAMSEKGKAS
jgi:hypothetical protein